MNLFAKLPRLFGSPAESPAAEQSARSVLMQPQLPTLKEVLQAAEAAAAQSAEVPQSAPAEVAQ